jgi:hypothetical protein
MNAKPYTQPLTYDLRSLLVNASATNEDPFTTCHAFWTITDPVPVQNDDTYYYRPDSTLLLPELLARDLIRFAVTTGNGFSVALGYGGGITLFFRALKALRIIKNPPIPEALVLAEQVADFLIKRGIGPIEKFSDNPNTDICDFYSIEMLQLYDYDMECELEEYCESRNVNSRWYALWYGQSSCDAAICQYLMDNVDLIERTRLA